MKKSAQQPYSPVSLRGVLKAGLLVLLILNALTAVIPTYAGAAESDASTIAAGVASGKLTSDIIKDATAKGMAMKDIFAALRNANISMDAIIYAAIITDGIAPSSVVSAAIQSGGDVAEVVAAAKSAGVSDSVIIKAAVSAGASRESVANAIANITSSSGQVGAGYSSPSQSDSNPAFSAPTVVSPTAGGSGGGGGGLPASPTKPNGKTGYK